jgi:signal transduction histidine kinase
MDLQYRNTMPDESLRVLSLLAHELRGPLGVIRGYLRLIDQTSTELSERSRESITAALRASDRISTVLDQASLLAHLHIGDVRLELKRVPLSTLVHAAIQAAALPQNTSVTLAVRPLPSVSVAADESRLRTALATFVEAVARAQSSRVIVEITARSTRLAGKAAVRLCIGPRTLAGVDPAETELDLRRGGFGLLLPIAAFIVNAHGGRVRELRHGERNAGVLVSLPLAK